MVGGGAEDIEGGSSIIFLPRLGGQIKSQTARGGAMKKGGGKNEGGKKQVIIENRKSFYLEKACSWT